MQRTSLSCLPGGLIATMPRRLDRFHRFLTGFFIWRPLPSKAYSKLEMNHPETVHCLAYNLLVSWAEPDRR
jgi:hypothetical protein